MKFKNHISTPLSCIPFQKCRAKTCPDGSPGTFVFDHCRYAGYVAEGLVALLPASVRALLPSETPFLVSLHDVGKVSPEYEVKYFDKVLNEFAPEWTNRLKGKFLRGHVTIGAIAIMQYFGLFSDDSVVSVIAAHHGVAPGKNVLRPRDDLGDEGVWQAERENLISELAQEFGSSTNVVEDIASPVDLLTGITCVADWIASDESFFPPNETSLSSEEGRRRAANALMRCGFVRPSFRRGLSFRDVFGFDPRPAQAAFLEEVSTPGVYVLEAPMGMGKTEAALYAAYRLVEAGFNSGLYFALPTRLTSDRIYNRVRTFLDVVSVEPSAVKLAHGQAWLKKEEVEDSKLKLDWGAEGLRRGNSHDSVFEIDALEQNREMEKTRVPRWFNPSKRGLLFPFAVGTIDQALLAVLNVKHSFVRSFGLAGKVVVLDEVHSYDAYTGTLLDELVKRLRELGCTVIILSATLTAARRAALFGSNAPAGDGYPFLAGVRTDTGERIVRVLEPPPSRSVGLCWIDASVTSPLEEAVAKARAGCNVLCITNTVATAQEWFRSLKEKMSGNEFPVGLLHSKFTGTDRERIENDWMSKLGKPPTTGSDPRPHGSILVATQIVEQSVDIDADWMLSELAPADMLLQRLGRLWRHDREVRPVPEPELAVVCARMPADDLSNLPSDTKALEVFFGRGVWVYAPYVLLRTFETLRHRDTIRVPDDIRDILETIYSETIPGTDLHHSLHKEMTLHANNLKTLALQAQNQTLPENKDDDASTRYNSRPSVSLLLVKSLDPVSGETTLLNGRMVTLSRFQRDIDTTRALYANLVQVAPNDILLSAKQGRNELLCQYFFASDMPILCKWDSRSGDLSTFSSSKTIGYAYHPYFGAYRKLNDSNGSNDSEDDQLSEPLTIQGKPTPLTELSMTSDPEGQFLFDNGKDW